VTWKVNDKLMILTNVSRFANSLNVSIFFQQ